VKDATVLRALCRKFKEHKWRDEKTFVKSLLVASVLPSSRDGFFIPL